MINYSFIIPHKNTPDLLNRCLDSIPQREDIEVIVVDDNSNEGEKPVISRSDVVFLMISKNDSKGAGNARNKGLAHANGKWLLFADADDYYVNGFLNVLDRYKDCDADVVFYNHQIVKGQKVVKNPYPFVDNYSMDLDESLDEVKYRFFVPWNKMVKRNFIEKYNIAFEETPVGEDIVFNYMVGFLSQKVAVDKTVIYNYLINAGSTIRRKIYGKEFYISQFKHNLQCNEFLNYIGYPQWGRSVLVELSAILLKKGIGQFLFALRVYVNHYKEINASKAYFVDVIKSKINA